MVRENRSLLKLLLLSFITFGFYGWYYIHKMAEDTNILCNGDGKKTPGLIVFLLLSVITCGIYGIIWYCLLSNRLYMNAPKYGVTLKSSSTSVILWMTIGSLLFGIGPLIATYRILHNMNDLARVYNQRRY